jgi:aspartyl-tRNA(Asn)/glutamyl-tRNA(Gln) amidotransferase subunit C
MAIDREQLLHVAHLARLELRENEIERLEGQLNDILVNVWDEDEPRSCLSAEDALANAPEREGDFFRVPPGDAA